MGTAKFDNTSRGLSLQGLLMAMCLYRSQGSATSLAMFHRHRYSSRRQTCGYGIVQVDRWDRCVQSWNSLAEPSGGTVLRLEALETGVHVRWQASVHAAWAVG